MTFKTIENRVSVPTAKDVMFEIHRQIIVGFSPISDWYFIPKYVV